MKKLVCLLISAFIFIHAFSQERKTYRGEYQGFRTQGEATYQYFENADFERIYDGPFRYNSTDQNYGISILISGSYKNNLKNGLWSYKLSQLKPRGEVKSLSTSLTGEYQNGNMIKKWSLMRTTIFTSPYYYNDPNSNIINEKSFCTISNGRFIGPFEFTMRNQKIKGSFDSNGFLDGEWRINFYFPGDPPFEEIRNYKNGICYKIIS